MALAGTDCLKGVPLSVGVAEGPALVLREPTVEGVAPAPYILVLSASGEHEDVLEAVKAGATGYLVKSASREELLDAVRRTAKGEAVYTAGLAGMVLGEYRRLATSPTEATFGTTTTSGGRSRSAARSSRHQGVPTPLILTASVPRARAPERFARAASFAVAATPSSRSTTTSSTASPAAFASMRSLEAGTVRLERRGLATART